MPTCHFCGTGLVREIADYARLSRVTSDCKAWPAGGQFGVCRDCGFPQTITSDAWRAEIARIYGSYTTYFQGAGAEQSVFEPRTGKPRPRSELLLERLLSHVSLEQAGVLLDVGCGNGNFLRAFAQQRPAWILDGSEWDEKYLEQCRAIRGFRRLHTGSPDNISGSYDVVSIIHCLEHVPNPTQLLAQIHDRLAPNGLLLIQVPDCASNPFMLTVADHCSHFSTESLAALVAACGFDIAHAVNTWIPKEITIVARKSTATRRLPARIDSSLGRRLESFVHWLSATSAHAHTVARNAPAKIGLFGTAIAGTWLHAELRDRVGFFVDEDPHRTDKTCLGLPVYSPARLPPGATVYVGLPPTLAAAICERLKPRSSGWVIPPPL